MTTLQTRLPLQKDRRKNSKAKRSQGRTLPAGRHNADVRESLRDWEPRDDGGLLLVGMCTIAAVAKTGHFFEGTYGRRVWKKLAAGGLHDMDQGMDDDECWAACGNGVTDVVKRAVRTNNSLKPDEIAAGVEVLRKKVRKWRPRAILFAFKNAAEAVLGERKLSPGFLATFEGVPTLLLTGPYAKPDAVAEECRRLESLRAPAA